MKIQKLAPKFFEENKGLVEVLDKARGEWTGGKERGYGIVMVSLNNLTFGIPLRSHINHSFCYRTGEMKGLDYTKAVLIKDETYISDKPFKIPSEEYVKIADREIHISRQFEKYVLRYVKGHESHDQNIIGKYRYSTLQNYHQELGIS